MESRWIWPFELLDKLGEGGMGVVYRARYVRNDRQVAVKLLPPDAAANKTLLARFEREMEVLKRLDHPNIVHCFGGTCEGEQRFYAMELIDCGTLAELLREKHRLSWEVVVDYAIQMCDALQYAHERGVIHRDIKPSNILMTKQGQLKLSDFGLVTVVTGRRLTASGRTLGTVEYMSPEQIRGKPPLNNRSDLYALGCVIHEMLIGQPPYSGENTVEIMHRHLKDPVPHIIRTVPDVPLELDELVCELLAKTPELRPDSAEAVKRRLEDILQPGRRFRPVESRLLPPRTEATNVGSTFEEISTSESFSEVTLTPFDRYAPWGWLVATCLAVFCLIGWVGWSTSSNQLRKAEGVLVDQLDSSDLQAQQVAVQSLSKFGKLHATTISKLNTATKSGSDAVMLAALTVLTHHADECRAIQWEIYKLQQNTEVSSDVRIQAGITVEEIKKSRGASNIGTIAYGSLFFAFMLAVTLGGWWVRCRFFSPARSNGTQAATA